MSDVGYAEIGVVPKCLVNPIKPLIKAGHKVKCYRWTEGCVKSELAISQGSLRRCNDVAYVSTKRSVMITNEE